MNKFEQIAESIFRQQGLDFNTAERAGGWTNYVWLNGDLALRLSKEKNSDKIRRETERSKMLPASVGYPANIATDITCGYEWNLSKRINGKALCDIWSDLSWSQKAKAVRQILCIINGIHSVEVDKIKHLTLTRAWYNSFDKEKSLADINRYMTKKIFTPEQGRILCNILERFYEAKNSVPSVLNHGDITMDNLLWHEGNIVSLLDFEHAVIAPRQLDIHSLVNLSLIPYDEATDKEIILLYEKELDVQQYVKEMILLLKPFLTEQYDKDLLMGYSVLFRQRFLEFWIERPIGEIKHCDAYQKLLSLSDGYGGYLSKLLYD